MDGSSTPTGSVTGPLQAVTPERVNRRDSNMSGMSGMSPARPDGYESPVLEKISQYNIMSGQGKLERKTAEAALKRAVVGREEAEAEMRRLRDFNKSLKAAAEEGKDRERKVGERLETVMVS